MLNKRVNILTFHNSYNYGAVLQCYALKNVIKKKFNIECIVNDIVNDKVCNVKKPDLYRKTATKKGKIASVLLYPLINKKYKYFNSFINNHILNGAANQSNYDDIYVCGSDQVWNHNLTDFDKRYFLDFVNDKKRKNAYSASFGFDEIPDEYIEEYRTLLSAFNKISVREQQGANILKNLLNIDVPVTLDPSLLLNKDEWSEVALSKSFKKEYILMYLINVNDTIINFAKHLKNITGLDIIFINDQVIHKKKGIKYKSFIGPKEWISLFLNARYVVTNSFHGVAFSINFNKDFFVDFLPSPAKVNSRLENIVKLFNLEDRIIINGENKNTDKSIDYEAVNRVLEEERQKSLEYLKSIVEESNE